MQSAEFRLLEAMESFGPLSSRELLETWDIEGMFGSLNSVVASMRSMDRRGLVRRAGQKPAIWHLTGRARELLDA